MQSTTKDDRISRGSRSVSAMGGDMAAALVSTVGLSFPSGDDSGRFVLLSKRGGSGAASARVQIGRAARSGASEDLMNCRRLSPRYLSCLVAALTVIAIAMVGFSPVLLAEDVVRGQK